jgi:putative glutamine amidotransferase
MRFVPFIGVTTSSTSAGRSPERAQIGTAYLDALQEAGAIPVLLPPQLHENQLAVLLSQLDGIMLTGGGDVDPAIYNERPHPSTAGVLRQRDDMERAVIHWAAANGKPLLAICRGMQILNVTLGGSLYQHLPDVFGDSIRHAQQDSGRGREETTHAVEVKSGTLLASLVGAGSLGVNSMHHQAVRAAGSHLVVSARAPDGTIEAVEAPSLGRFVVGVQWHPEELAPQSRQARALFEGLVEAARGGWPGVQGRLTEIRPEAAGELTGALAGRLS